jgi:hypothetical protein
VKNQGQKATDVYLYPVALEFRKHSFLFRVVVVGYAICPGGDIAKPIIHVGAMVVVGRPFEAVEARLLGSRGPSP